MGRDAEIRSVNHPYGGLKGITVFLTISDITTIYKCCLKSPDDKIYLGKPTDIRYNWSGKAEET
jgi:hypothetical protein